MATTKKGSARSTGKPSAAPKPTAAKGAATAKGEATAKGTTAKGTTSKAGTSKAATPKGTTAKAATPKGTTAKAATPKARIAETPTDPRSDATPALPRRRELPGDTPPTLEKGTEKDAVPEELAAYAAPPVAEPLQPAPGARDYTLLDRPPLPELSIAALSPQRAAIDAAFLERADLRRGLTENLRAKRADGVAVAGRVTNAFSSWNPTGLSTDAPEARNYVPPGADPGPALDAVIERRVAAVSEAAPHTMMKIRKGDAHGTMGAALGDLTAGALQLGPLTDYIFARSDSLVASAPTPSVAACVAAATAADIVAEVDAAAPAAAGGGTSTGNGVADPKDVDELVDRAVNRQMRTASAPEDRLVFGRIPAGDHDDPTQQALMETFELRPGASDVTSYHDFNTLQIAFEHVWTSIFDGQIESLGRELYKEYVGLKDFLGDDSADRAITTIDDLRRLMGEIQSLSQIAQAELPSSLGGAPATEQPPKSGGDIDTGVKVVAAVATGGLSVVIEWAIREFAKIGQKPVLTWEQVNGGKLARGDRITARVEQGVAPDGLVELVLETDSNSHVKLFSFQQYVEAAGRFTNVVFVDNRAMNVISRGGVSYFTARSSVAASLLPSAMIEFASEETSSIDTPGRYCLGKLGDRLRSKSRVTFYWQDF